ncbi:Restriction endonuclease BpuJI - N terminal [Streptococcus pneumoniae]|nr:restriction endonuclease [Streptococcus pneumoniae 27]KDE92435.1 restriction endonuclease [Streptococcus pneumoniae]PLV68423.1 restriction endonuclease [Streptococcus pneumoniae]PLV71784.1 restriction endonuclease [Streptococcus pneumoniae]CKH93422.1 Restriction endonuclease BpuJI-N terminal [Streptococcus pneumoniae]
MYQVPEKYYFRLHHPRPRFKNDVENVLVYMATNISYLGILPKKEFSQQLNDIIKQYAGNADKTEKTINNWRTEISSLFGMMIEKEGFVYSGNRAKELTEDQDLIRFFKTFLYNFEYPGGHLKDNEIVKLCQIGVQFKPAQYLLELFTEASQAEEKTIYLTDEEVAHCIFNDLRCTRDREPVLEIWNRIKENRASKVAYDTKGDVIRYAKDVLDYMVIASLLTVQGGRYKINSMEEQAINDFLQSDATFDGYAQFIGNASTTIEDVRNFRSAWFEYVNRDLGDIDFRTNFNLYLPSDIDFTEEKTDIIGHLTEHIEYSEKISTAVVGSSGEAIVINHEKQKLREHGQEQLLHLVNFIPTQFGVGYDVQSFECDDSELRKYIEVKTTVSNASITFNSFHITPNEWRTAKSVRDRYYIYRLQISKHSKKLFIIKNLYELVKNEKMLLIERKDGYDARFSSSVGFEENLI